MDFTSGTRFWHYQSYLRFTSQHLRNEEPFLYLLVCWLLCAQVRVWAACCFRTPASVGGTVVLAVARVVGGTVVLLLAMVSHALCRSLAAPFSSVVLLAVPSSLSCLLSRLVCLAGRLPPRGARGDVPALLAFRFDVPPCYTVLH